MRRRSRCRAVVHTGLLRCESDPLFRVAIGGSSGSISLDAAKLATSEKCRGGVRHSSWPAHMEKSKTIVSGVIAAVKTLPLSIYSGVARRSGSSVWSGEVFNRSSENWYSN